MEESSILPVASSAAEPLKRIKEKAERLKAEALANDAKQSPTVRLRAYLSIGKIPPRELATEENIVAALNLDDQVNFLPKLAALVKLIKAEVPLHALLSGLKDLGSRTTDRLSKNLSRITRKWEAQVPPIEISDLSILYFFQILERIARFQRPEARNRPSKKTPTKNPYLELLKIGTRWGTSSASPALLLPLLKILGSAERLIGTTVEDLAASNAEFSKYFENLIRKSLDRCEELVEQSMVSEFHELTDALVGFPAAGNELLSLA